MIWSGFVEKQGRQDGFGGKAVRIAFNEGGLGVGWWKGVGSEL